jgi:hypothetical protein
LDRGSSSQRHAKVEVSHMSHHFFCPYMLFDVVKGSETTGWYDTMQLDSWWPFVDDVEHVRLVDGWCWFVLREKYCWLVACGLPLASGWQAKRTGRWFVAVGEKHPLKMLSWYHWEQNTWEFANNSWNAHIMATLPKFKSGALGFVLISNVERGTYYMDEVKRDFLSI